MRISKRTLHTLLTAIVACVVGAGCATGPHEHELYPSRSSSISISGYLEYPSRCVRVQALSTSGSWQTVATTLSSSSSTSGLGMTWYSWSLPSGTTLGNQYWHPKGTSGYAANLRAYYYNSFSCSGTQTEILFFDEEIFDSTGDCQLFGSSKSVSDLDACDQYGVEIRAETAESCASNDVTCDGRDDDCNGSIDDGYVPTPTSCGDGVCASSGALECVSGAIQDSCAPGSPTGPDDDCDGIDEDCDASSDESFSASPTSCGQGVCGASGTLTCNAGVPQDSCVPGSPTGADDNCNGEDEDCDGLIDEGFVASCSQGGVSTTCVAGVPQIVQCNDGNICNGEESCSAGFCVPGTPPPVPDDGNPCTTESCSGGMMTSTPIYGTAECPNDLVAAAPSLPTGGEHVSFADDVAFLYGSSGIQTGLTIAIDPQRATRLFGEVRNGDGYAFGGVEISIHNHPEYGTTHTRADGKFDLVVNGGGTHVVVFERDGHMPVHRPVDTMWNEHTFVDDVVLLPYDTTSTMISFGSSSDQSHTSSTFSDSDGDREIRIFFPAGVNATMMFPDGTSPPMPLTSGNVRSTEVTVGPYGPAAMPAPMPQGIMYTHAADISFDEAVLAGASTVEFDSPVYTYVDNFIGFDVGELIPVGFYDSDAAVWRGEEDGVVVEIASITGGVADIDIDGDGDAENAAQLAAFGFTTAERTYLAGEFAVGDTFWRMPRQHFCFVDHNSPAMPPPGAENPPPPDSGPANVDDPSCATGSIIQCENQTVAEEMPIAGTGFALRYQSDRVLDHRDSRRIRYPIADDAGSSAGNSRLQIRTEIDIAGRRIRSLPSPVLGVADPNDPEKRIFEFEWDGLDWAGRTMTRPAATTIRTCFDYPVLRATARVPSDGSGGGGTSSWGVAVTRRTPLTSSITRGLSSFQLCSELASDTPLGPLDAAREHKLGGLSFTGRHHLAVNNRRLYRGNGSVEHRTSTQLATTMARSVWSVPDPADSDALINAPCAETGVIFDEANTVAHTATTDPEGRLVFAAGNTEGGCNVFGVFRVEDDGTLTRLAGNNQGPGPLWVPAMEGADALTVPITNARSLAYGPDGSLYLGMGAEAMILRLWPDGTTTSVAGYSGCNSVPSSQGTTDLVAGEGEIATNVCVHADDMVVDRFGGLYFVDTQYSRIRYLDPSGRIYTVVGGGDPMTSPILTGDSSSSPTDIPGANAREVRVRLLFGNTAIALDHDERVLFALDGVVVRVEGNGTLSMLTGSAPQASIESGDPASAYNGAWDIRDLFVDEEGRVVFLGEPPSGHGVWRIDEDERVRRIAGGGTAGPLVDDLPPELLDITLGNGAPNALTQLANGDILVMDQREEMLSAGTVTSRYFQRISGRDTFLDFGAMISRAGERYEFDADGRHERTVDPATGALLYSMGYDGAGRLGTVTDAYGNAISVSYSASEIRFTAPYGEETIVELDATGRATIVRYENDPNPGAQTVLAYDGPGGLLDYIEDRRGNKHDLSFDSYGRLIGDVHDLGASWTITSTDVEIDPGVSATRSVTLTDSEGRARTHEIAHLAGGQEERRVTNPDGTVNRSLLSYDSGRLVQAESFSPDGSNSVSELTPGPLYGWARPYPSSQTVTLPSGASTRTETTVDATAPEGSLDADSWTATIVRNADVAGDTRTATVTSTRQPDGTWETITTSAEGRRTRSVADANGRILESGVLLPSGLYAFDEVRYTYDAQGRLEYVRQGTGANERVQRYHYTSNDLPISDPPRGYPLGIESPEGDLSTFAYDSLGQVTREDRYVSASTESTELGYDVMGQLSRVRPPGRSDHAMTYSGYEAMATYEPPLLGTAATNTTWTPGDERNEIASVSLPDGRTLTNTYDATTGRLEEVNFSVGKFILSYAPLSGETIGDTGQLRSVSMPQIPGVAGPVGNEFVYDGPLLTEVRTTGLAGGTRKVLFDYDDADEFRLRSIQVDALPLTTYTYDDDGLLLSAGTLTLTRNADTGIAETASVGTVSMSFVPNGFGEPAQINAGWGSDSLDFAFTYDLDGRIQTRTETSVTVGTKTLVYQHDDAGRLTDVTVNGASTPTYHYEYDENGNRIAWDTPTGSCSTGCVDIDEQDRLTRYGSTTYTYNDYGQLTSKTKGSATAQYFYDELGNLRRVIAPGGDTIDYVIDGMNRRVGRIVNGSPDTYWIYQDGLNPVAQLDGSGAVEMVFVYGTKAHVPDLIEMATGQTLAVVTDQVGSVRRIIDTATGALIQSIDYSPFGVIEASATYVPGFGQPFRFAGGLWDADTGLVRFGARDYDPEIGRWTAKDPILFGGGDTNLYVYGFSNPVDFVDTDGLDVEDWIGTAATNGALRYGDAISNFSAGFGDALLFGFGSELRALLSSSSFGVDECSTAYDVGEIAGIITSLVVAGGAARALTAVPKGNIVLYRGTDYALERTALEAGKIVTVRALGGVRFGSNPITRGFQMFRHSLFSAGSPYVSATSSAKVAAEFGKVYRFEVPASQVTRAWWNILGEAEYLIRNGTKVFNVTVL